MKKNIKLPSVLILVSLVIIATVLVFRYINKKTTAKEFLQEVKDNNKSALDSLQNKINYENHLHAQIKEKINQGDFATALKLIDTLEINKETGIAHVYKGMIYFKQLNYLKAVEEYNIAIEKEESPIALGKRAEAYLKMNKLDQALHDYKKAYEWNYDYSFQVANTYETKNIKDSAVKYYLIYLKYYPDNQEALQRINFLKKN